MKKQILFTILLWMSIGVIAQAQSVLFPFQGGTGTSTNPGYGDLLVGSSSGTYDVLATSTLGINFSDIEGTLDISDQSNLTVTSPITLTDDDIGFDFTTGNTWIGLNQFQANASTTQLSVYDNAWFGATATSTFDDVGQLGIGELSPAYGIEVTDQNFGLSDSNVSHGITSYVTGLQSNTYAHVSPMSVTGGGLRLVGISDAASTRGITLQGIIGSTNPTDSVEAIMISAARKTGSTITSLADEESVFAVSNNFTELLNIIGSGNIGISDTSPTYKLDVNGNARFTNLVDASHFVATSTTATSTFAHGIDVATGCLAVNGVCTALDTDLHDAVTLAGENYLSLSGQEITANAITLSGSNVTGTLGIANGGTATTTFANGGVVFSDGSTLKQDSANLFWDNSNDRLGIRNNAPVFPLHVKTDTPDVIYIQAAAGNTADVNGFVSHITSDLRSMTFGHTGTTFSDAHLADAGYFYTSPNMTGGLVFIATEPTSSLRFYQGGATAGDEKMRIHSNGNIGIGTTTPGAFLHVLGTTEQARFGYDQNNYGNITVVSTGSTTISTVGTDADLFLETENISGGITLDDSAVEIGIWDTTPGAAVDIGADITAEPNPILQVQGTTSNTRHVQFAGIIEKSSGNMNTVRNITQGKATGNIGSLTGFSNNPKVHADSGAWNFDAVTGLQSLFTLQNGYTGTVTDGYGINILSPIDNTSGAATLTNLYGIRIQNQTIGTNVWGIYVDADDSYFGGNVGIGTTTPLTQLSIEGITGTDPFDIASSTGASMFRVTEEGYLLMGKSDAEATFNIGGTIAPPLSGAGGNNQNIFYLNPTVTQNANTTNMIGLRSNTTWIPTVADKTIYSQLNNVLVDSSSIDVANFIINQSQSQLKSGYSGTVDKLYGFRATNPIDQSGGGATLNNAYAFWSADFTTATNNWGIYMDGTMNNYFGGNVGIGTTTPITALHALSTTEQLRLGYDQSNYASFTVASDGALTVQPTGTDADIILQTASFANALYIDDSTAFNGMGTTTPKAKLDVNGAVSRFGFVSLADTTGGQTLNTSGYIDILFDTDTWIDTDFYTHSAGTATTTVLTTGLYKIEADCSTTNTSGTSRSDTYCRLENNGTEIANTQCAIYNRLAGVGDGTCPITTIVSLQANDEITLSAIQASGTDTIQTFADFTRITFELIRAF